MNKRPVMIIRVCAKCKAEFGVKAIVSRATYCPECRAGIKQSGMVLCLDRRKFDGCAAT